MGDMLDKIRLIEERRAHIQEMGGAKEVAWQHEMGKLTIRERLDKLFDKGTFEESGLFVRAGKTGFDIDNREIPADGFVAGTGKINGRPAIAEGNDYTVLRGSGGTEKGTFEMAIEHRIPYIVVMDTSAARMQSAFSKRGGRAAGGTTGGNLSALGFRYMLSGVVPQITLMLGPMYAGMAYNPIQCDFVIMRDEIGYMSVTNPAVLKSVTFQDVGREELGGARMHATVSGTCDVLTQSDEETIEVCRELLSYLPLNNSERPPFVDTGDDPNRRDDRLREIVPADLSKPYDMHEVIRCIVDNGKFLEIQALYAKSLIMGFARLNGQTVGIVANNPAEDEGVLTINSLLIALGKDITVRREKLAELLKDYINYPYHAAEQLLVNEIIDPRDTRANLIATLESLAHKEATLFGRTAWKKHSLMPR